MIKRLTLLIVVDLLAAAAFAQVQRPQQEQPVRPLVQAVQQLIVDAYISGFRSSVGLNEEQFLSIVPYLRTGMRQRFMVAQRIENARRQLDQRIGQPTDEEVRSITQELQEADQQALRIKRMFFDRIDPTLTANQRLLARKYQQEFEQDLRQKIDLAIQALQAQQREQLSRQSQQRLQQNKQQNVPGDALRGGRR